MHDTLYKIQAGKVSVSVIPSAGMELPVYREFSRPQPVAVPGAQDDEWDTWSLECVTEIATSSAAQRF